MSNNIEQEMEKTILPNLGLDKEHLDIEPIFRTYHPGSTNTTSNAMALYADGQVYRYSDEVFSFENGKLEMKKAELKWRKESNIKEESVQNIINLLDEFEPTEANATQSISALEISYQYNEKDYVFQLQGDSSPKNYMIFTKINNEISLGTIPSTK